MLNSTRGNLKKLLSAQCLDVATFLSIIRAIVSKSGGKGGGGILPKIDFQLILPLATLVVIL